VRVASPRDVTPGDDVTGEQVPAGGGVRTRRARVFNESFRAAVDRSYTKQQPASSRGAELLRNLLTSVNQPGQLSLPSPEVGK